MASSGVIRLFGDAVDEVETVQEVVKLESSENSVRTFRPLGNGIQAQVDFFGGQGRHIFFRSICDSPRTAFLAAARELVYGSPSAGFRILYAHPFFLVARFDVRGLTFLFVSVAGFIALKHDCF